MPYLLCSRPSPLCAAQERGAQGSGVQQGHVTLRDAGIAVTATHTTLCSTGPRGFRVLELQGTAGLGATLLLLIFLMVYRV